MYSFSDGDIICSCKGTTKKQFLTLVDEQQLTTLDSVRDKTGINKNCGLCITIVEALLVEGGGTAESTNSAR